MNETIVQRHLFKTNTITIEYNGVRICEKSPIKQQEYFIDYERIPSSTFAIIRYEPIGIMTSVICAVASIVIGIGMIDAGAFSFIGGVFIIAFTAIPTAMTYFTRTELVGLGFPGSDITLHMHKPVRATAPRFLDALQQAKVRYLRDIYMYNDDSEDRKDALRRLLFLKNHGALLGEEFEERRKRLL